jgi:hypothetical protein
MKKLTLAISTAVLLSSCAIVKSPVVGLIYTDVKAPFAVTNNSGSSKVGTAEATSILGLVAQGDASIETAAKAAGITKIHHIDEHVTGILGVYSKYQLVVYGE